MQPRERLHGIVLLASDRLRLGIERLRHRAAHENGVFVSEVNNPVNIRRPKDLLHAIEDGMASLILLDHTESAFALVSAMVIDPLLAQDLPTKLTILQATEVAFAIEGMGRCAKTDHRLASVEEIRHMNGLFRTRLAEARRDDHQIRVIESRQTSQPLLIVRVDVFPLLIPGEHHRAVETVMLTKNLAQHRERLLGAVFLIARDENHALPLARAFLALQDQGIGRPAGQRKKQRGTDYRERSFHDHGKDVTREPELGNPEVWTFRVAYLFAPLQFEDACLGWPTFARARPYMKRKYEGVIILNTIGKEESIDKMVSRVGATIEAEGGKLQQIDRLGRKDFAYPSNKIQGGFYVNYFFEAEPSSVEKIRSALTLNDEVHVQHYQVLAA